MYGGIRAFLFMSALAMAALAASTAQAVPVRYRFSGQLELTMGSDFLHLDGATLTIVAKADTDDLPDFTYPSSVVIAEYTPSFLTSTVSDRPGGLPDAELLSFPPLFTDNFFMGRADLFGVSGISSVLPPDALRPYPTRVSTPFFAAVFTSDTFFPGTGAAPLPIFEAADVASILTGEFTVGITLSTRYRVIDASITATAVPEPHRALLVAGALAVLARRARR